MRCRVQKGKEKSRSPLSLPLHLERSESTRGNAQTLLVHQGMWLISSIVWHDKVMRRMKNLSRNAKCRFCNDFFGSRKAVLMIIKYRYIENFVDESDQYDLSNEETRLRFTNQRYEMPAPVVVYADFESAIDDKNKTQADHVVLSSRVSYPSHWQPTASLPCTTYESEEDLCPFMDYLTQLQSKSERVSLWWITHSRTLRVSRGTLSCNNRVSLLCHKKLENDKVRHHAHVAGEYTPQGREGYAASMLDSTFAPVVPSVISNSPSTRRTIVYPYTSTMAHTTISRSSWNSSQLIQPLVTP